MRRVGVGFIFGARFVEREETMDSGNHSQKAKDLAIPAASQEGVSGIEDERRRLCSIRAGIHPSYHLPSLTTAQTESKLA